MPAPGYSAYVAPAKYAQIAWVLGLGGRGEDAARARLFARVDEVLHEVGMPRTLHETGIAVDSWSAAVPELSRAAFADPSGRTNPRMPLLAELRDLLRAGFEGR
jgi:acetaldehyde dehydrogenase/alcohol dehydrogenase